MGRSIWCGIQTRQVLLLFFKCRRLFAIRKYAPTSRMHGLIDEQEGAVVFVLKRLRDAQRVGDIIHAQIRSLATGHNGSTRTMFTPSTLAQTELLRRAQAAAKVSADDIDICEGK